MKPKTHKQHDKNNNCGNQVKQGTSRNNQETTREWLVGKRFLNFSRSRVLTDLLSNHLHVASQWHRADEVLGVSHFFSKNFRSEAKRKSLDPNADKLGSKKMTKFMYKDDEPKDNNDLQNDDKCCEIHDTCMLLSVIEDLMPQCNIVIDKGGRE